MAMTTGKKLGIGALVVVVVAAAVLVFALTGSDKNNSDKTASTGSTGSNSSSSDTSSSSSSDQKVAVTITYSDNGFLPASVTVKSGDMVAVKNTSSNDLEFESNPHPVHTDDTDLNLGDVAIGKTETFTVTKKGSFGYHNHFNPSDGGKITIE